MRNLWIRFGCFLTGYNYSILRGCSEAAVKAVKKFTAAIIIICILWFFIGFTFAQRYLQSSFAGCLLAGFIAVVIVVQIEKQIILSINPSPLLLIFRGCLAFMMSILGAVIIDQVLLEKDIELEKISYISERVNKILPDKTRELRDQIAGLDTTITAKERQKELYVEEISKQPTIEVVSSQTVNKTLLKTIVGASGRDSTVFTPVLDRIVNRGSMPNPKILLNAQLDSTIGIMRQQKAGKENELLHIRPSLEKEMSEKTGFLDELKVTFRLLLQSNIALAFWALWILFFLFIEMLVLVSKTGDKSSDYEKAVLHHMNLQKRRLDLIANSFDRSPDGIAVQKS